MPADPDRFRSGQRWRIEMLVRDRDGREAWQDAMAAAFPSRENADKFLAILRTRRPTRQFRLTATAE
jgi:hypothetical protein